MKVLLTGDWHGNVNHARWVLDLAVKHGINRVFQLGDFGAWEHNHSGVEYFDQLEITCRRYDVTLYWLDGNHDKWSDTMARYGDHLDDEGFVICRPNVRYSPRGHRFTWDKVMFMTLGGAYSVDKQWRLDREMIERRRRLNRARYGASFIDPAETEWFSEEELTDEQVMDATASLEPVDVLLTHDKPARSDPRWNRKDFQECLPNQLRIQQVIADLNPKLIVHGHLHHRYADQFATHGGRYQVTCVGLDADLDAADHPSYTRYDNVILLNLDPETGWLSLEEIIPP